MEELDFFFNFKKLDRLMTRSPLWLRAGVGRGAGSATKAARAGRRRRARLPWPGPAQPRAPQAR